VGLQPLVPGSASTGTTGLPLKSESAEATRNGHRGGPEREQHAGRASHYRVLVTRYRDWRHIEVPTLDVHAQSRLLRETEPAARAAISSKLETGADSFDVAIELQPALAEKLPISSYLTSRGR
jgi:hypothetical protein